MRKLLDFNIGCKRKLDIEKVLRIVCFMTIAVACYSILTYGQTDIHSDTATATLLAQSQIRNQSLFPISWNYTASNRDVGVPPSKSTPMSIFLTAGVAPSMNIGDTTRRDGVSPSHSKYML